MKLSSPPTPSELAGLHEATMKDASDARTFHCMAEASLALHGDGGVIAITIDYTGDAMIPNTLQYGREHFPAALWCDIDAAVKRVILEHLNKRYEETGL